MQGVWGKSDRNTLGQIVLLSPILGYFAVAAVASYSFYSILSGEAVLFTKDNDTGNKYCLESLLYKASKIE